MSENRIAVGGPEREAELHSDGETVVAYPAAKVFDASRTQWLLSHDPKAQFLRYGAVGIFNTLFGYADFVLVLTLVTALFPHVAQAALVVAASLISTPLNITVSYFGYKFLVFRTKSNYMREWLKAFAVYGTSMIPGLLALSALTRVLQSVLEKHAGPLRGIVEVAKAHTHGKPLAGYIAGALITGLSTIYSFFGHRNVTFRSGKIAPPVAPRA